MGRKLEILNEVVLKKSGAFEKVRKYLKGWHSGIPGAVLIWGLTGKETRIENDVIRPTKTFTVYERKGNKNTS